MFVALHRDFQAEDVYCMAVPGSSTSLWQISPPNINNLKQLLNDSTTDNEINAEFAYSLTRNSSDQNDQLSETVSGSSQIGLNSATTKLIHDMLTNADKPPV